MNTGWIAVDLDGTLAKYTGWQGEQHIGDPIPLMLDRVRLWLANGIDVRISNLELAASHKKLNDLHCFIESVRDAQKARIDAQSSLTNDILNRVYSLEKRISATKLSDWTTETR